MAIDQNFIIISKRLRKDQTPWEKKLWMYLRGNKFYNFKFKRQLVIGPYIYDFSCFEKKIIIELDGSQHKTSDGQKADEAKENFAKNLGYKVVRFNNNDVQNNIEGVLETIRLAIW